MLGGCDGGSPYGGCEPADEVETVTYRGQILFLGWSAVHAGSRQRCQSLPESPWRCMVTKPPRLFPFFTLPCVTLRTGGGTEQVGEGQATAGLTTIDMRHSMITGPPGDSLAGASGTQRFFLFVTS